MHASQKQTGMGRRSLEDAAEFLRVIAHPIRMRLIQLILQKTSTVGELARACGLSSAFVSSHLRLMQQHELLARARDGRQIYYYSIEPFLPCILEWLADQFESPRLSMAITATIIAARRLYHESQFVR
jgi:DNA-binding transcriptional ArsR family regulator